MAKPDPSTVRELIAWSYANLARAHAALEDGAERYSKIHHVIRNRLYHGLVSGRMSMGSILDDERLKMTLPQACSYCGSREDLSVDHLIPKIRGGADRADNLVWACRSCNSSKGGRDLMAWASAKGFFPPLLLLRRYLKVVAGYCEEHGLMDSALESTHGLALPLDLRLLPVRFPAPRELILFARPKEDG